MPKKTNTVDRYNYKSFHDYREKIRTLAADVPMSNARIDAIAATVFHREMELDVNTKWSWKNHGIWSPARSLEFRLREEPNKERALVEASFITPKIIDKFMDDKMLSKDEQDKIIASTNTSTIPRTYKTRSAFDELLRKRFYTMPAKQTGVYMLYDDDRNLLYIGTSSQLPFRASRQCLTNMTKGAKYVSFIFTDDEKQAMEAETNLIRKYKPIINKQEVHGKPDTKFKYPRKTKLYKIFSEL